MHSNYFYYLCTLVFFTINFLLMKKLFSVITLLASIPAMSQQNVFFDRSFWNENTSVSQVKTAIEAGNSPSALNEAAFDAPSLAILGNVPTPTAIYLIEQEGNSITKTTHDGRTYLFWAASSGNVALIHYLLEQGSDIYAKDTKGYIPVTFAALFGNTNPKVYEAFFRAGIDPKATYDQGETLLLKTIAFDSEQLPLTQYFISKGLKLKQTSLSGATAFDYASRKGNVNLLKTLRKKVKPTHQALPMAAEGVIRQPNNPIEVYQYLIENQKIPATATDYKGGTALHYLARRQDLPAAQYLIEKGANIEATDKDDNTCLMNACYGNNLELVKLLLKGKEHINKANGKGETALLIALQRSSSEVVALLLAQGADTRAVSKKGVNVIEALLASYNPRKKGNDEDFDQKAALLKQYLVALQGANAHGDTALHMAVVKGNLKLVEKIWSWPSIDINAQNEEGETPLIKAALTAKDTSLLKLLIDKGANKALTTSLGETAYELAKENENLQKSGADLSFLK